MLLYWSSSKYKFLELVAHGVLVFELRANSVIFIKWFFGEPLFFFGTGAQRKHGIITWTSCEYVDKKQN